MPGNINPNADKQQLIDHKTSMVRLEHTSYFYQRALLDAINLSAGILITGIMIFRIKNSNI